MRAFYVTFGLKYSYQTHPKFAAAHPDGYLVVEAQTEDAARQFLSEQLGDMWSFIYTSAPGGPLYPRGELARWRCP